MPRSSVDAIWEKVKANRAALDGCAGPHDFEPCESYPSTQVPSRYRCRICRGEVDSINRHWYESGLEHGRVGMR